MKFLQLYKEKLSGDLQGKAVSVHDNMDVLSSKQANDIAQYLENGIVLYEFITPIPDIINPKVNVPHVVFSDCEYAWDGMLVYWVKNYRIRLPADFISHVFQKSSYPNEYNNIDMDMLMSHFKESEIVFFKTV